MKKKVSNNSERWEKRSDFAKPQPSGRSGSKVHSDQRKHFKEDSRGYFFWNDKKDKRET